MTEELKQAERALDRMSGYLPRVYKDDIEIVRRALTAAQPAQEESDEAFLPRRLAATQKLKQLGYHYDAAQGHWLPTPPAAQDTPEPTVTYATVRAAYDELHIECRFSDGQKFAAVTVAQGFDNLAHRIETMLNESQQATPEPVALIREMATRIKAANPGDAFFTLQILDELVKKLSDHARATPPQQAAGEPGRAFYDATCFAFDVRTDWKSLPETIKHRYALAAAKLYTHPAPGVPKGYALVGIEVLEAWGKLDEVKAACVYPYTAQAEGVDHG